MLWDIYDKKDYKLYVNRAMDLKIKVYEEDDKNKIHINYKGYNVAFAMLVWEFGEDLNLASIENVHLEGKKIKDRYFVIDKADKDNFLDEIYFFLVDYNMDSVFDDSCRVDWKE